MPTIDPAWIALIGTLCGGIGLKMAEHYLGRRKVRVDDASRIRDELRMEIASQREELRQLEIDVEKWRADYYSLFQKYVALQTDLTIALEKIKQEAKHAEKSVENIGEAPPPTPGPLTKDS